MKKLAITLIALFSISAVSVAFADDKDTAAAPDTATKTDETKMTEKKEEKKTEHKAKKGHKKHKKEEKKEEKTEEKKAE